LVNYHEIEESKMQQIYKSNIKKRIEFLLFKLSNNELALEVSKIREVIKAPHLNKIPGSHEFVIGVINFRGRTIPVIKLDKALNIGDSPEKNFIVITDVDNKQVGLLIDNVDKIISLDDSDIKPIPSSISKHYLSGILTVNEKIREILNLEKVFESIFKK